MKHQETERARWFAKEVHPHESALRGWLHAHFPSLVDVDDLVQDSYVRLFQANGAENIRHPKAFLFATARNAVLDLFRRKQAVSIDRLTDLKESSIVDNGLGAAEIVDRRHRFEILTEAVQDLPERCRQVITLRYHDGLSNKAIAAKLGISPETVKAQLAKGMRRCAEYFQERGLLNSCSPVKDVV